MNPWDDPGLQVEVMERRYGWDFQISKHLLVDGSYVRLGDILMKSKILDSGHFLGSLQRIPQVNIDIFLGGNVFCMLKWGWTGNGKLEKSFRRIELQKWPYRWNDRTKVSNAAHRGQLLPRMFWHWRRDAPLHGPEDNVAFVVTKLPMEFLWILCGPQPADRHT